MMLHTDCQVLWRKINAEVGWKCGLGLAVLTEMNKL